MPAAAAGSGAAVVQDLGRRQPRQPGRQFASLHSVRPSWPLASPARPGPRCRAAVQRQQQRVGALGQQFAVGHRAGRDHAHHLALDRALGGGHVAHLLGDRHRLAQLDQPRQVALQRMHRHAGHHHRLAGALAARVSVMSSSRLALRASS
jgi:hypothetical protein